MYGRGTEEVEKGSEGGGERGMGKRRCGEGKGCGKEEEEKERTGRVMAKEDGRRRMRRGQKENGRVKKIVCERGKGRKEGGGGGGECEDGRGSKQEMDGGDVGR